METSKNCLIENLNSFDDFLKNYDSSNDYECSVFLKQNGDKIRFISGTLNFIGARTSRGKTTALISITTDALKNGKKAIFVTTEESSNQIIIRLISNIFFNAEEFGIEIPQNIQNWKTFLKSQKFDTRKEIINALKNQTTDEKSTVIKKAKEKLEEFMKNKSFCIYDSVNSQNLESMISEIEKIGEGGICLIDYIQRIKEPKNFEEKDNRFSIIKKASEKIADSAKKTGFIVISSAQFGRTGNKEKTDEADSFTDESFQECSSIEQIGEVEIGIGRHFVNGEKKIYYSILKDRGNGNFNPNEFFEIEANECFSNFNTKADSNKKPIFYNPKQKQPKKTKKNENAVNARERVLSDIF